MADTIPPDNVAAGQAGHIDAHNNIADVLTAFQAQLAGIPAMHWGTATLVSGTVSVTLASVDSASIVFASRLGPSGTLGHLSVPTISAGSGFTITSSSASDDSAIAWLVLG